MDKDSMVLAMSGADVVINCAGWYMFGTSKKNKRNGYAQLIYSGQKAEQELGLSFRSPEQAWRDTLEAERRMKALL